MRQMEALAFGFRNCRESGLSEWDDKPNKSVANSVEPEYQLKPTLGYTCKQIYKYVSLNISRANSSKHVLTQ